MALDWLLERFASAPQRLAFVHEDRAVTYGELRDTIEAFRATLRDACVQPGDRVAVVGDYTPEAVALLLALAGNANIAIPLSRESAVEVDAALEISGCDWRFEFALGSARPTLSPHNVTVTNTLLQDFRERRTAGLVLFSSGSTGRPKGILHDVERVAAKFMKQREPVVAIPFLMFDHFGGFNTILAITSSLGTVVSVADRSVKSICEAIQKHRVALLPATPSFLNLLVAARAQDAYDLTSLQRITYGTEVMSQATLDRLRLAFPGVRLQQTYGLSEVGVLASQSREDGSLWMRLGGDGFRTRVVDGTLRIRSDFSMVGYLNAPSAFDEDGWFDTQDRVEVDGEYFRVLGRVTDLINVGGQKVYPAEIEETIMDLPNVVDVAVFGERNALMGQIIVARIALAQPEPAESLKARVRAHCKQRLAAYKVPVRVLIAGGSLYGRRHKKNRQGEPAAEEGNPCL